MIEVDLRKYFNPKAVVQYLTTRPPIKTPILDLLYPESRRVTWPLPIIGIEEITKIARNVPVIRRGTPAIPVSSDALSIDYIEPQPIEVSDFIAAAQFNNLKMLQETQLQTYIEGRWDFMRDTIKMTTVALAVQGLTGSISYPMKIQGGYTTYSVTFGTPNEFVPETLWDDEAMTLELVLLDLISISQVLADQGYGTGISWLAGAKVYARLASLVLALNNGGAISARITENGITIAGFTIQLFTGSYVNPQTGLSVKAVADNKICAVSVDAPTKLIYCALDDMEAGLQPLPFWATQETKKNPSGVEILGKSKPLPVPVPKAICWATVLSE